MIKEIYLAGGCFWGCQKYFNNVEGVIYTEVGYCNGNRTITSYQEVCDSITGHAECVKIKYDNEIISINFLLGLYFNIIDPTSLNKQGEDSGIQYRTGIYYVDGSDLEIINSELSLLATQYDQDILVEVDRVDNYCKAEEYHQDYLDKNPQGYCHLGANKFEEARLAKEIN